MSAFGRLTYHIIEGLKADVQMSTYNHHWRSDSFEKANEFSGLRTTTAQFGELNRNKLESRRAGRSRIRCRPPRSR